MIKKLFTIGKYKEKIKYIYIQINKIKKIKKIKYNYFEKIGINCKFLNNNPKIISGHGAHGG